MVESYRDLEVWQHAREIVKRVYRVSTELPDHERFGLISQMQRAAVSIPANIAEGWASGRRKIYLRHLAIARGSLAELETFLTLCIDLDFVDNARLHNLQNTIDSLGRMINRLQQSLQQRDRAP